MPTLKEVLVSGEKRPAVIEDCCRLIDAEVASKTGFTGLAVKACFATVKAIKPGMIRHAVDDLLDDFTEQLDPFYAAASQAKTPVDEYLRAHAADVAEALLRVTDGRAAKSTSGTVKKAYEKLRPSGKKHTMDAVPGLSRIVKKYAA